MQPIHGGPAGDKLVDRIQQPLSSCPLSSASVSLVGCQIQPKTMKPMNAFIKHPPRHRAGKSLRRKWEVSSATSLCCNPDWRTLGSSLQESFCHISCNLYSQGTRLRNPTSLSPRLLPPKNRPMNNFSSVEKPKSIQ